MRVGGAVAFLQCRDGRCELGLDGHAFATRVILIRRYHLPESHVIICPISMIVGQIGHSQSTEPNRASLGRRDRRGTMGDLRREKGSEVCRALENPARIAPGGAMVPVPISRRSTCGRATRSG